MAKKVKKSKSTNSRKIKIIGDLNSTALYGLAVDLAKVAGYVERVKASNEHVPERVAKKISTIVTNLRSLLEEDRLLNIPKITAGMVAEDLDFLYASRIRCMENINSLEHRMRHEAEVRAYFRDRAEFDEDEIPKLFFHAPSPLFYPDNLKGEKEKSAFILGWFYDLNKSTVHSKARESNSKVKTPISFDSDPFQLVERIMDQLGFCSKSIEDSKQKLVIGRNDFHFENCLLVARKNNPEQRHLFSESINTLNIRLLHHPASATGDGPDGPAVPLGQVMEVNRVDPCPACGRRNCKQN